MLIILAAAQYTHACNVEVQGVEIPELPEFGGITVTEEMVAIDVE